MDLTLSRSRIFGMTIYMQVLRKILIYNAQASKFWHGKEKQEKQQPNY